MPLNGKREPENIVKFVLLPFPHFSKIVVPNKTVQDQEWYTEARLRGFVQQLRDENQHP